MADAKLKLLAEHGESRGKVLDLIKASGFFSDLDTDEIEMLSVWVKAFSAPTGTVILKEGDEQPSLCIVVEGVINIFKKVSTEEEHIKVAEISTGASIGEMGVVDGQPLSATAISAEDALVLIITAEDFKNLIKKNSNLGIKILLTISRIISIRLRNTTMRLADLLAIHKK